MAKTRISRTLLLASLAAVLIFMLPSAAMAHVGVGIGFGYWGYPYGYWGPGPYWGYPYGAGYYGYPGYYGGYYGGYYQRPMGKVEIKSPNPDAEIYINGSLAGRAHDLKHFYLRPGRYEIEQRIGDDVQHRRVYVLANRTLRLRFGPAGAGEQAPPPEQGPPPEYDQHGQNGDDY